MEEITIKKIMNDLFVKNQNASNQKDKLKGYIISDQVYDPYGNKITENELNKLPEQTRKMIELLLKY